MMTVNGNPMCMDTRNLTPIGEDIGSLGFENVGSTPDYWALDAADVECATCCIWSADGS
jgi:hypothetical protein